MANFVGISQDDHGLSDQLGGVSNNYSGWQSIAGVDRANYTIADLQPTPQATAGYLTTGFGTSNPSVNYVGHTELALGAGAEWFEKVHVIPRAITLGNIITEEVFQVELFNAFKETTQEYASFANNADVGITDITDPAVTPPEDILPLRSIVLDFNVASDGAPNIDGTLDFEFTGLYTAYLPVTGQRLVLFSFRPEVPVKETLEFLTTVHERLDGTEQRITKRKNPRQLLNYRVTLDAEDRQALDIMLFNWSASIFGVPIWWEPSVVTSVISIGDTVINVDDTSYGDFRVGGLAVVFTDRFTFDALEISGITANTITFNTAVTNAYGVGSEVFPVRTAIVSGAVRKPKRRLNVQDFDVNFVVDNNDANLADASAFNTFNGAVILDGPNLMSGDSLGESWERQVTVIDNETGRIQTVSRHTFGKLLSTKGFKTNSRQSLWELRQLLHYLKGKTVSFYVPSFFKELTPNATLVSGNSSMSIVNVGYSVFVNENDPKKNIRVHLTDGTTLDRVIQGSSVISSTTEQLTLDTTWPSNIEPEGIDRIEWLDRVRLDSDVVDIFHNNALGEAQTIFPVKAVFEA